MYIYECKICHLRNPEIEKFDISSKVMPNIISDSVIYIICWACQVQIMLNNC